MTDLNIQIQPVATPAETGVFHLTHAADLVRFAATSFSLVLTVATIAALIK